MQHCHNRFRIPNPNSLSAFRRICRLLARTMSECPELQDFQQSGIFEYVSPAWFDENNLTGSAQPARVRMVSVAPSYFALLRAQPELGRTFDPQYNLPGY